MAKKKSLKNFLDIRLSPKCLKRKYCYDEEHEYFHLYVSQQTFLVTVGVPQGSILGPNYLLPRFMTSYPLSLLY